MLCPKMLTNDRFCYDFKFCFSHLNGYLSLSTRQSQKTTVNSRSLLSSPQAYLLGSIDGHDLHLRCNKFSVNSSSAAIGSIRILLEHNYLLKFSAEWESSLHTLQIEHSPESFCLIMGTTSHPPHSLKCWPSKTESSNSITSELCESNSSPFPQQNLAVLELLPESGDNGPIQHWATYAVTQLFTLLAMLIDA